MSGATEGGTEVHLDCAGEAIGRTEGDVDVPSKHFRNVRTRNVETLRERRLVESERLHPLHYRG